MTPKVGTRASHFRRSVDSLKSQDLQKDEKAP